MKINALKQLANGFGTHHGNEIIPHFIPNLVIFIHFDQFIFFIGGITRVNHDEGFIIEDAFQILHGHIQQSANLAGSAFYEPDVRNGYREGNMSHTGAAHSGAGYQHITAIANCVLKTFFLIFSAGTFIVPFGAKNSFTEKAVFFGF